MFIIGNFRSAYILALMYRKQHAVIEFVIYVDLNKTFTNPFIKRLLQKLLIRRNFPTMFNLTSIHQLLIIFSTK